MRWLSGAIALCVLVGSAEAQNQFWADVTGGQVVPPVSTNAGGYAFFTLNADNTLTYEVRSYLVSGTAAHIHVGDVGQNGSVVFTLSGGPSIWSGTTVALSASERADLRASGYYVSVESAAHMGGEIRGQIEPRPILYGAHITADQETPPNGSTAVGDATIVVNSDMTLTYNVTTTGISATAAHIHVGAFGVPGGIDFVLAGGPTTWSGTTAAMTTAQFNRLQALGYYVNIHSIAFPAGEIRGQIVPTQVPYGVGSASSVGVPTLEAYGVSMRGGAVGLKVAGGLPSGNGLLILSLDSGVGTTKLTPYLLGAPFLIIPLPLDAAGSLDTGLGAIPDLSGSIDLYAQYFGIEQGGPSGNVYATNGVKIPLFDY